MKPPVLTSRSSVLAVVPHFKCDKWLAAGLESLLSQTRQPDGIVVVDDASPRPPVALVGEFPGVTLMGSSENAGQYRLMQQIISQTGYDAYLFQDADDWSAPERLESLLCEAVSKEAELVGSHEMRVMEDGSQYLVEYPAGVNRELRQNPGAFPILLCTALASKDLIGRIGGLAGGMRICGDYDFILRAQYAATVVNVPKPLYFRRIHPEALTSRRETGFVSNRRMAIHEALIRRDRVNAGRVKAGKAPDLTPFSAAEPIPLRRLCGPSLRRLKQNGD